MRSRYRTMRLFSLLSIPLLYTPISLIFSNINLPSEGVVINALKAGRGSCRAFGEGGIRFLSPKVRAFKI